MGLCFYQKLLISRIRLYRLNPLVMGLCFYRHRRALFTGKVGLNPLVMGLCFYLKGNLKCQHVFVLIP